MEFYGEIVRIVENMTATGSVGTSKHLGTADADEILNLDDETLGGILQSLEAFK